MNKPSEPGFLLSVSENLARHGHSITAIADRSNPQENRIFEEYGAVFLTKAVPPPTLMFESESEVLAFQTLAGIAIETMDGVSIELQPAAMMALKAARSDAHAGGVAISPRDGTEAARRSYQKTLELWNSRFEPALEHWKSNGRLEDVQILELKSIPIREQVGAVLELEKQGIFFNTFFNNSILYSVAAPGTSQHLSMLAFDAAEFSNRVVQEIMAVHGWFRTVQNDAPHFTYLGYSEDELTGLGLQKVTKADGEFWIPDLRPE